MLFGHSVLDKVSLTGTSWGPQRLFVTFDRCVQNEFGFAVDAALGRSRRMHYRPCGFFERTPISR